MAASSADAHNFELHTDIVYAAREGKPLHGNLYLPNGQGPFPLLIAVHGGGWVRGARDQFQSWGPYLAQRGIAVFAVTYRFAAAGRKMFPEAVHDIRASVQFARANAGRFHIDPERIGLFGASAGAHLAALVALGEAVPDFQKGHPDDPHAGVSAKVKLLIGFYGVYDMLEMWRRFQIQTPDENNVAKFLGVSPAQDRRIYFDASPISYATHANKHLAVFLSVGTEDDLVNRVAQTDAFLLALKQAGIFVRGCVAPGAPHYYVSDPIEDPQGYNALVAPRLMRFLGERL